MRLVVLLGCRGLTVALAVLALVLIGMRLAALWPRNWREQQGADATAIIAMMGNYSQNGRSIYVMVDGRDPEPDVMEKLRIELAGLRVRPFSERSAANDHCGPLPDGSISVGACEMDDFVKVDFLAVPLWRTSLLRGSTAACGYEFVLVKGFSRWHVASRKWMCT